MDGVVVTDAARLAHARTVLAPLSERATSGAKVCRTELCEAAAAAYGVSLASLAPLLAWADS